MRSTYRDLGTLRRTIAGLLAFVSFFGYIQLKYLDSWSYTARIHQRSLLYTVEGVGHPQFHKNITDIVNTRQVQVHQPPHENSGFESHENKPIQVNSEFNSKEYKLTDVNSENKSGENQLSHVNSDDNTFTDMNSKIKSEEYTLPDVNSAYILTDANSGTKSEVHTVSELNSETKHEVHTLTDLNSKFKSEENKMTEVNSDDNTQTDVKGELKSVDQILSDVKGEIKSEEDKLTDVNIGIKSEGNELTDVNSELSGEEYKLIGLNSELKSKETTLTNMNSEGNRLTDVKGELKSEENKLTDVNSKIKSEENKLTNVNSEQNILSDVTSQIKSEETSLTVVSSKIESEETTLTDVNSEEIKLTNVNSDGSKLPVAKIKIDENNVIGDSKQTEENTAFKSVDKQSDDTSNQITNAANKITQVKPKAQKQKPLKKKPIPQLFDEVLPLKRRNGTDTNYTRTPLLLLFSSWAYSQEKADVHATTLRLWSSWPFIKTAVLTTDPVVQKYATAAGWEVSSTMHVHRECFGPPVLAPMFTQLMKNYNAHYYGYSNSDIMYGDGLAETLKFLHEHDVWRRKPLLIVGRRHNVDFINSSNIALNTTKGVAKLTTKGTLVNRSTDFFFTNKHFPWGSVPEVSVGRPFVVRSIIGYALHKKIAVIDATKTIQSVHLTTKDGNLASWHKKGVDCNKRILAKGHWQVPLYKGHCECALLETFKDNGVMKVRHRKADKTICH